jgi:LCP family protein required for cell wall assembly
MDLTETFDDPAALAAGGSPPGPPRPTTRGTSPGSAAILSLLFPGLGQIAAGAARRGLVLALPTVALIVVVAAAFAEGAKAVLAAVVQPGVLYGIIVLNGVYAIYHLFAVGDAFRTARRRRTGPTTRRATALLAVALVATVGLHGLVGAVGVQAYQTVSTVFVPPGSGYVIPLPSFAPTASASPGSTLGPTATPGPAWAADGRLNLLLIGGDSGPGRTLLRTDTMILLSVDVATGRAALFGIPRNLIDAPLPPESARAFPDGRFPGLLNALYVYAYEHPTEFPAGSCTPANSDACGPARGFRAITGAIQQLTGVPLDGAVVVDLNGFVDLVDAIGGLWIRTEHVYDTKYPLENGRGYVTIDIPAGCHHLTGHLALAYARSRHQDSDYGRMRRQQAVLVALLHEIDPIALVPKIPQLLDIAKDNLTLAIPTADIGSLAALASSVDPDTVERISFDPPDYREFLTTKEIGKIQKVVRTIFETPLPSPSASPSASPSPGASFVPVATPKTCGPG